MVALTHQQRWSKQILDALASAGIRYLPYVPDGVLAGIVDLAEDRDDFTLIPLTREEEGVGIAAGIHLGGGRAALLCQVTGLGNSLNAVGSLVMAQRIPLLIVLSERGGLGETVSTQVPFGNAADRVLDAIGIPNFEVSNEEEIPTLVKGAADLTYVSRVPSVLRLTPRLVMEAP